MMTINQLVDELAKEDYKIKPRTIKSWVEMGLLPKPKKKGGVGIRK